MAVGVDRGARADLHARRPRRARPTAPPRLLGRHAQGVPARRRPVPRCRHSHRGGAVQARDRAGLHPALPRRQLGRDRRRARDRADEDDDLAARRGQGRRVRRRLQRPLLRLPRAPRRALGPRPAPADLREGPRRPGRPLGAVAARPGAARPLPRGLPASGLRADADRLSGQSRHAGPDRPGMSRRCTPAARRGSRAPPACR